MAETNKEKMDRLFAQYETDFSEVTNLSIGQFLKIKDKSILVDVRADKERKVSTIPGAISLAEFKKRKDSYKDQEIVFYCTLGVRSGPEAKKYLKKGFTAKNLKGSILGWAHADLLFEKDGQKTNKVHTFNKDWDLLPEGYEAVY